LRIEIDSISSGFKSCIDGISTLSTRIKGAEPPVMDPMAPRIFRSGSDPTSPLGTTTESPGIVPCNPRPISAIGLASSTFAFTEETDPVRLAFFCVPNPTTTTSLSVSISGSSKILTDTPGFTHGKTPYK
jgi:hypothetical protein